MCICIPIELIRWVTGSLREIMRKLTHSFSIKVVILDIDKLNLPNFDYQFPISLKNLDQLLQEHMCIFVSKGTFQNLLLGFANIL